MVIKGRRCPAEDERSHALLVVCAAPVAGTRGRRAYNVFRTSHQPPEVCLFINKREREPGYLQNPCPVAVWQDPVAEQPVLTTAAGRGGPGAAVAGVAGRRPPALLARAAAAALDELRADDNALFFFFYLL
ncbi:unnamed protein product [Spodoptera exigua]|nr:unnamed protein product [Spodoptera exigua]